MESLRQDRDEAIAGIRRGLAEANAGKGTLVLAAVLAIRAKRRIPDAASLRNHEQGVEAKRTGRRRGTTSWR